MEFAAHGLCVLGWVVLITDRLDPKKIARSCQHPFCVNTKKNMNPSPASNPAHPDHLDYFAGIVRKHLGRKPSVPADAYVAPGAFLSGSVTLGPLASIWPSASLRGDIAPIVIGERSNVQDNAVIHVATDTGVTVGKNVTIGHGAIVHACTIGDESLIGMGAIILDGAVIGKNCLIGAHATVLMNTVIPDGSMVVGSPARIVRSLTLEERSGLKSWADHYLVLSAEYRKNGIIHPDYSLQG